MIRKIIGILLVVVTAMALPAMAGKKDVKVIVTKDQLEKTENQHKSPIKPDIDVYYDDESREIEVISNGEEDAQIFLYDNQRNILDYSPTLNTILTVPLNYTGFAEIYIEAECWTATARIEI